jgi:AhpD family alkylhydroperoxidase
MIRTHNAVAAALLTLLAGTGTGIATARAQDGSPAAAARADIQKTLGFVPRFFLSFPDTALPGAWEEMKTLQLNPATTLSGKVKEAIGLAVSSQIPCRYCIVAHTEFGKLAGASTAELGDAVTMAAITRHWSTFLNGIQTDDAKFRGEVAQIIDNVKRAAASKAPPPAPVAVVDGASALRDVAQTLGFVPDFIRRFPDAARAGAWRQMKEVQLNPRTALSGKDKELVGLAVASQVPCRHCIVAHTEFAKLNGATDAEISEAIAMAALTRNLSTMLNGLQVDESQFRRDVARLVRGAQAASEKAAAKGRTTAAAATR